MLKTLRLPRGNRQGAWWGQHDFSGKGVEKTEKPNFQPFENKIDPEDQVKKDLAKETRVVECCHGCGRFVQLPRNWNIGSGKISMPCGKCTSKKHIDKDGKRIEKPKEPEVKGK